MSATLYFEDVVVGSEFEAGDRLVTEEDLRVFTDISGDRHPIHTDPDFAAATPFGRPILQGPFGIAVVLGLFGEFTALTAASIALTDIRDWRFRAPIFVGDRLGLRMRIADKTLGRSGSRGMVDRAMTLLKGDGSVAQEGRMGLLMLCRPAAPASN